VKRTRIAPEIDVMAARQLAAATFCKDDLSCNKRRAALLRTAARVMT
jgi:hypothetical protein